MDVDGMTVEEMEAFAKDYGLPALLDHLGLDGLGNKVVALYEVVNAARGTVQRLTSALDFLDSKE